MITKSLTIQSFGPRVRKPGFPLPLRAILALFLLAVATLPAWAGSIVDWEPKSYASPDAELVYVQTGMHPISAAESDGYTWSCPDSQPHSVNWRNTSSGGDTGIGTAWVTATEPDPYGSMGGRNIHVDFHNWDVHEHNFGIEMQCSKHWYPTLTSCGKEGDRACWGAERAAGDRRWYRHDWEFLINGGGLCDRNLGVDGNGYCTEGFGTMFGRRQLSGDSWENWAQDNQRYGISSKEPVNWFSTLGSHESFNSRVDIYSFPNQFYSIYDQLTWGVRLVDLRPRWIGNGTTDFSTYLRLSHTKSGNDDSGGIATDRFYEMAVHEIGQWLTDHPGQVINIDMSIPKAVSSDHRSYFLDPLAKYLGDKILTPHDWCHYLQDHYPTLSRPFPDGSTPVSCSDYEQPGASYQTYAPYRWPTPNEMRAMGKQVIIVPGGGTEAGAAWTFDGWDQGNDLSGDFGFDYSFSRWFNPVLELRGSLVSQTGSTYNVKYKPYFYNNSASSQQRDAYNRFWSYETEARVIGQDLSPVTFAWPGYLLADGNDAKKIDDKIAMEGFPGASNGAASIEAMTAANVSLITLDEVGKDEYFESNTVVVPGLHDRRDGAIWSWAKGDLGDGGGGNGHDCAVLGADGKWHSRGCTETHRFACARPRSGDPTTWPDVLQETWKMTTQAGAWSEGSQVCEEEFGQEGYIYASPRNGRSNRILSHTWNSLGAKASDPGGTDLWLSYSDTGPARKGQWTVGAPPVVTAGPYAADEGSTLQISATGQSPGDDALTYAWDFENVGLFNVVGQTAIFDATLLDGPTDRTIRVKVTDANGFSTTKTATVHVNNVIPTVAASARPDVTLTGVPPSAGGSQVRVNLKNIAAFNDPCPKDTHSALIDWGDGSPASGANATLREPAGLPGGGPGADGVLSASHVYASSGDKTVQIRVVDDDGGISLPLTQTVHISTANLGVDVTGLSNVESGGILQWTATVHNSGPESVGNVALQNLLPSAVKFLSAFPTKGAVNADLVVSSILAPRTTPENLGTFTTPNSVYSVNNVDGQLGYSTAMSGDVFVAGAPYKRIGNDASNVNVYRHTSTGWGREAVLFDPNLQGPAFDFGASVAVDRDTIVIGSPGSDKAYVYTHSDSGWTQRQVITPATTGIHFGSKVAVAGDWVMVAADGAVYPYHRVGSMWGSYPVLTGTGGFGSAISLDRTTLAVGAPLMANSDPNFSGVVTVFKFNGTDWATATTLPSMYLHGGTSFGASVSLSGDTLAATTILAPGQLLSTPNPSTTMLSPHAGVVVMKLTTASGWQYQDRIDSPPFLVSTSAGAGVTNMIDVSQVVVTPDTLGIVEASPSFAATNPGHVKSRLLLYKRIGNYWVEQARTEPFLFSVSAALSPSTLALGQPFYDAISGDPDGGNETGRIMLYESCVETPTGTLNCNLGNLAPNETASVPVYGQTACTTVGDLTDFAKVFGGAFDPDLTDNISSFVTTATASTSCLRETPPTILPEITGTEGKNGWYRDDVTVHWNVKDYDGNVVGLIGCDDTTINTDTAGTILTCRADSVTDNPNHLSFSTTQSVTIKRDATRPTLDNDLLHLANRLFKADRDTNFTCDDAASGVDSCTGVVHLTTEGANQSVTGTAEDMAGNTTQLTVSGITLDKTAPTVTAQPLAALSEGDILNAPLATFTDNAGVADYSATIDWGDGSAVATQTVHGTGGGTISGSHFFADNGSAGVKVCVTDPAGNQGCSNVPVSVNNLAPTSASVSTALAGQLNPDTLAKNGTLSVTAAFNDRGILDTHHATIDWGDGTPIQNVSVTETVPGPSGSAAGVDSTVTSSHVYALSGTFDGQVCETDKDGGAGCAAFGVSVGQPPPVANAHGPYTVTQGGKVTLSSAGSAASDNGPLAVAWDLDHDGNYETSGASPTYNASQDGPGDHTVGLKVCDSSNVCDDKTALVHVLPLWGDVDLNGTVNASDVILLLGGYLGLTPLTQTQIQQGDVRPKNPDGSFGDGAIGADDINWILRRIVGLVTTP